MSEAGFGALMHYGHTVIAKVNNNEKMDTLQNLRC